MSYCFVDGCNVDIVWLINTRCVQCTMFTNVSEPLYRLFTPLTSPEMNLCPQPPGRASLRGHIRNFGNAFNKWDQSHCVMSITAVLLFKMAESSVQFILIFSQTSLHISGKVKADQGRKFFTPPNWLLLDVQVCTGLTTVNSLKYLGFSKECGGKSQWRMC